jgi:putative Ca2+/H+ antiporter (TMEM165/GDT1 family)
VLQAFLISLSTVALAEMGDRTQLLALILATRFRRPMPILAGMPITRSLGCWASGSAIS